MQNYTIDIQAPHGPLVLYIAQGDAQSRIFQITVTDGGAAYTFPDGAAFSVRYGAQGMPSGWYDQITEADGSTRPAVSAAANVLTVEVASQATGKAGANALNVVVNTADGYQLASWPFLLIVTPVPGSSDADASVYYDLLSQQVAQVLANAQAAAASAVLAESWAVGGTDTREGEDTNNSRYWAEQAQQVSQGALGWYETEQALQAAHPTGTNGQWAIIGSTDTIWTWDSDTNAWVNSGAQVDLSNYYTKEQSDTRFATAAQGTKADSAVQSVNGKTGTAVTLDPQDVGGISTYTCTTSGTTHELTGTGNNIKFVADAAYAEGNTITVNGTTVTAQTQDGTALADGAWASGATVVCWLNGATLTVGGGGNAYTSPAYSTVEKWTGETIDFGDGPEKIYCKVFLGQIDPSQTPNIFHNVVSDWKRTVSLSVQVNNGGRNFTYIESSAQNTPAWGASYMVATLSLGNLMLSTGTEIASTNFYAIMKYTKTSG